MPSTYSSLLRLELMATGEKSATWGDITNTNLGTLLEKSIAGTASINVTAGNVTMTALNGTDDESRCVIINITGTPGVSRNVVAPSASKTYCVINGSNAAVVFKGAATTGITLSAGQRAWLAWNGSDFVTIGVPLDSPSFTGTTSVAALTTSGVATVGTGVGAGNYVFRVVTATGDRLRILSATSTNGVNIEVTDAGETTTARPLTLGASNTVVNLGTASQFTKNASGVVGIGTADLTTGSPLLAVGGSVRVGGGSTSLQMTDAADLTVNASNAGGAVVVRVAGAERARFNAAGEIVVPGKVLINGATSFAGFPLNVKAGTNQNVGVSSVGGVVALSGLTDAGASTNFLLAGTTLRLSGDGGTTTHVSLSSSGQFANFSSSTLRQVFTAAPTGSNGATYDFENWNNSSSPVALGRVYCQTTNGAVGNEAGDLIFYAKPSTGALAETLRLKDVGQLFTPRIHNNSSGASGTTPMIASGTYTPTFTNVAGTTANTPRACQWLRVGNVCHVSGNIDVTCSSGTGVSWRLSLPIASDLANSWELGGTAARSGAPQMGGILILGDTTNNAATFSFTNDTNTLSLLYSFSFTYVVL